MMFASPTHWLRSSIRLTGLLILAIVCGLYGSGVAYGQSQANAADLQGVVRDQSGAVVVGAKVVASNPATGFSRDTTTNDEGYYVLTNLPPGEYEVTVEATGFSTGRVPAVTLTVGQRADLDIPLTVGTVGAVVDINTAQVALVESSSTAVSNTIEQKRINDLPINERSATGFALTISTVGRDNGRPIGPAPTSGLNIGGQRGRSTLVQVDGADHTDNSINAARSTVSQEAVQEYQVSTNSYAPEFGRATGGIVNVVTKSGTNEFRGNLFGFLRHKSIQARNAFAPLIDNDPNKKPPFTRAQYGATLGGPIKKDRTFFFASFEQRRRQESGFFTSDVVQNLTSNVTIGGQTFRNISPAQATFINQQLGLGNVSGAVAYAYLASSGGSTGLNGVNPLIIAPGLSALTPIPAGQTVGGRFLLSGTPIPSLANNLAAPNFITVDSEGRPIAFRALNSLQRIFPISESSTYFSVRGDHQLNSRNNMTMRFGYNPSDLTGIQDESQNQTLGQNDFSRTGIQTLRDLSFAASVASTLSSSTVNEARFAFGRRKATFDSQIPGTAIQIIGVAFLGSNPFSPVDRTEKRFQFADNVNHLWGNHAFKFGGDINFIDIGARFDLNFPGLFNFGEVAGSTINRFVPFIPASAPALTQVQAYGLGFPGVFIEGFGDPNSSIKNKPLAFFAQDSWKIRPNFTLNYGVRYDVELTDTIAPIGFTDPLTKIALSPADLQTAQDVVGVQQGFPRDTNNIAPRIGMAWDIGGNGKTVMRAAYGIFYDHPLLAVAFNSDIGDAAQQQQYTNVLPGLPTPTELLNLVQIFHSTVCSPASQNPFCGPVVNTPGVAATSQYLPGRVRFNDQTFVGFGPILPFTLAVAKNFEYAYANQGNFTIERELNRNMSVSASYIHVSAHHLPHPQDINAPRTDLLIENFRRFAGGPPASNTQALLLPLPVNCAAPPPGTPACPPGYSVIIPGLVGQNVAGQRIVSPIAANFFRPSGPNYFFVSSITGGAVSKAAFDGAIVGSVRSPGPISPFGDVSAQLSDGNSSYNAMNLELKRRFSNNFQFLASYTWSHSIDDSSDLQTLLKPQDNRNFRAERADSLFDQRHRFVFSGALSSPGGWRGSSNTMERLFSSMTIAPILEISSGRPFNILTGVDANGDLQSSNDRPSVNDAGVLFIPTTAFTNGSLGRNRAITHGYASLDLRVMKGIHFGERFRLDLIAEGFNLFNRFNEAGASPFFQEVNSFAQRDGSGRYYSRPTAAYDPRQFQFGLKLNF